MRNNFLILFGIFIIALLSFSIFSTKVLFTDVSQYLGTAKEFAGISLSKVRNLPGWSYPLFLAQFLKFSPNLLTIKLINAIWLLFDALLIYYITKKKKSLIIFIFSPIVWYMSTWINPILPISFLILLSYHHINIYFKTNKKFYFITSSLLLGISSTLWWAATYISIFFIIAFFYDKKLIKSLLFLIPFSITFSIRLLIDHLYFKLLFFSIIRNIGSNFIFLTGNSLSQLNTKPSFTPYIISLIFLFFIISPIVYRLYKLEWQENKHILIFLILTTIMFLGNLQLRYFITIAPITIILLSKLITKKELISHIVISLAIIILLTYPNFGQTRDSLILEDINKITSEFPDEAFIVGAENLSEEQAFIINSLYFGKDIKELIVYSEYKLSLTNQTTFREYSIPSKSKINNLRKMNLKLIYERTDSRTYEDINYWIIIGKEGNPPKEFKLLKEYEILRLFKKE